ncbi:MAG: hypothetical protein AAGA90_08475 [Actinomycetota bacterium]
MSTIEREVFIQAPPATVAAALQGSHWSTAITVRPEGAGARVRIRAAAHPEPVAEALEAAMLDDVCAVKRRVE